MTLGAVDGVPEGELEGGLPGPGVPVDAGEQEVLIALAVAVRAPRERAEQTELERVEQGRLTAAVEPPNSTTGLFAAGGVSATVWRPP